MPDDRAGRVSFLPGNRRAVADETGALQGRRTATAGEPLLRPLPRHLGCGHALRETGVRARQAHVALLKRLRKSRDWLHALCVAWWWEQGIAAAPPGRFPVRACDAPPVKEPGKPGAPWRGHSSVRLPSLPGACFALPRPAGVAGGRVVAPLSASHGRPQSGRPGVLACGRHGVCGGRGRPDHRSGKYRCAGVSHLGRGAVRPPRGRDDAFQRRHRAGLAGQDGGGAARRRSRASHASRHRAAAPSPSSCAPRSPSPLPPRRCWSGTGLAGRSSRSSSAARRWRSWGISPNPMTTGPRRGCPGSG